MLVTLPSAAIRLLKLTGACKMVTDIDHALRIVAKMAKERYNTAGDVLAEFLRYQKNGECTHMWPDENTACMMLIERRIAQ